uniref:Uncharacterized protein n=1 Tax=Anguilla anguilla TaxID=7936 RepID=A0A0E9PZG0_ANGAN
MNPFVNADSQGEVSTFHAVSLFGLCRTNEKA